jgi:hypothetical protein
MLSEFKIKYEPKSITGLLIAAGIMFVGIGSMTGITDVTEYGNFFLLLGIASWFYHLDKYKKKSVKRKPLKRPRR